MKRIYVLLLICCTLSLTKAQVSVTATIDSAAIFIGEQAHIQLKVTSADNYQVTFPVYPDKILVPGIEVLKEEIISSEQSTNDKPSTVIKEYTVTSFDTALYYIPPFQVKVKDKTYKSKNIALKVETVDIDTLHLDKFFGPKDNAEVPFKWSDWKGLLLMSLLLLLLLAVIIYIGIQLHNNRPVLRRFIVRPAIPPGQWAIKEINKLTSSKESAVDTKAYYTRLTDVLRMYIQRRYGFSAREMTSREIITQLTQQVDDNSVAELRELFQTADLAKFAKLQTQLSENDNNLLRALQFVQNTNVETIEQPKPKPVVAPEIKRNKRSRLLLNSVLCVLIIASLLLLYFIARGLYYVI